MELKKLRVILIIMISTLMVLLVISSNAYAVKAKVPGAGVGIHSSQQKQGPQPNVTSWSPRKAYPGQTLVINGRGFTRSFVVEIKGQRAVALQITKRTETKIEAKITTSHYTGREGLPLVVYHRGGKKKTLTQNFKVVNKDTLFSGDSLWHAGQRAADSIWTRGTVKLRLNQLEFANSGTGTYSENVKLIAFIKESSESCVDRTLKNKKGKRSVRLHDFKSYRKNRSIRWSKVSDGRIQLEGIGLVAGGKDTKFSATARINGGNLALQYNSFSSFTKRRLVKGSCEHALSFLQAGGGPPLRAAPKTLVEWALTRVGP